MSVLPCHRNGCENVMCDRYNEQHGYICYECFNEAEEKNLSPNEMGAFMASEKGGTSNQSPFETLDEMFPHLPV